MAQLLVPIWNIVYNLDKNTVTRATSESTILPLLALLHILHNVVLLLNPLLHLQPARHLRIGGHALLPAVFDINCFGYVSVD